MGTQDLDVLGISRQNAFGTIPQLFNTQVGPFGPGGQGFNLTPLSSERPLPPPSSAFTPAPQSPPGIAPLPMGPGGGGFVYDPNDSAPEYLQRARYDIRNPPDAYGESF